MVPRLSRASYCPRYYFPRVIARARARGMIRRGVTVRARACVRAAYYVS